MLAARQEGATRPRSPAEATGSARSDWLSQLPVFNLSSLIGCATCPSSPRSSRLPAAVLPIGRAAPLPWQRASPAPRRPVRRWRRAAVAAAPQGRQRGQARPWRRRGAARWAACTSCGSGTSPPARSRPAACAGLPACTAAWGLRARRATVSGGGRAGGGPQHPHPPPGLQGNGRLLSTALKRLREAANGNDLDTGEAAV